MQLITLLAPLLAIVPLVASTACVAGGPADQVAAAKTCCSELTGTWYVPFSSSHPLPSHPPPHILPSTSTSLTPHRHGTQQVQGICVLPDWATFWWKLCVLEIPNSAGLLDTRCIPGDGGDLTIGGATSTMTSSGDAPVLTFGPGV